MHGRSLTATAAPGPLLKHAPIQSVKSWLKRAPAQCVKS